MIKFLPPYAKDFVGKSLVHQGILWTVKSVGLFHFWIETKDGTLGHRHGCYVKSMTLDELLPSLVNK